MYNQLRAFGFTIVICFGVMLVWGGFYLMAGPIQTFEFILKEILAGIILLAIGLFSIIFPINYSLSHGKVKA